MKILFIAGHGQGDSGAVGNGYLESDLTRELVNLTYNIGIQKGLNIEVYNSDLDCYQQSLKGYVPNYRSYDYVLEFHFNAFNGQAYGCEILVHPSESGVGVEEEILKGMTYLGFFNRGIKRRNDLLNLNNCRAAGTSYALIETCFIDNENDINLYQAKKTQIASYIIEGILKGFDIIPSEAQKVDEIAISNTNEYEEFGTGYVQADVLNIRDNPSTDSNIVGSYTKDETFNYNYVIVKDDYTWVRYTSFTGYIRYVAVVNNKTGERYVNCY